MDRQKTFDNNSNSNSSSNEGGLQWTNEKHSNFLRGIEASFVRNMLKRNNYMYTNNNNTNSSATSVHHRSSRLDRFVPDISESTLDLHKSDRLNRQRERPIRPYKTSHDQVVPQIENQTGDKK